MNTNPEIRSSAAGGTQYPREVRHALDRAQQLLDAPLEDRRTAAWAYEALHVGDMSVLALALMQ